MRKTLEGRMESSMYKGRILARILAEDLRNTQGGFSQGGSVADTVTDLGDHYDITNKGGDAAAY